MSRTTELDPRATPAAGTVAPAGVAGGESDLGEGHGLIEEDGLIEEISIDGMCGVY